MKKYVLLWIAFTLCVCYIYGKTDQYTNAPNKVQYRFGAMEINKSNYIYNLRTNVQNYLEGKRINYGWSYDYIIEFQNAYKRYIKAFEDPNKPYRFYTDEFGTITDKDGVFSDKDLDDYWYDKKGNKITGSEYRSLKDKQKKKYRQFHANREVASYFYKVGKKLADKKAKAQKEATNQKKATTQNRNNSEYMGW